MGKKIDRNGGKFMTTGNDGALLLDLAYWPTDRSLVASPPLYHVCDLFSAASPREQTVPSRIFDPR